MNQKKAFQWEESPKRPLWRFVRAGRAKLPGFEGGEAWFGWICQIEWLVNSMKDVHAL